MRIMTYRPAKTIFTIQFVLMYCCTFALAQEGNPVPIAPKPKIRTITAFIAVDRTRYQIDFSDAVDFLHKAQLKFERSGYAVQTLRIATQPFPEYTNGMTHDEVIRFFKNLDGIAQQNKIRIAIGPAYLGGDDGEA